eukprot:4728357-Amphidinium_carterae.1
MLHGTKKPPSSLFFRPHQSLDASTVGDICCAGKEYWNFPGMDNQDGEDQKPMSVREMLRQIYGDHLARLSNLPCDLDILNPPNNSITCKQPDLTSSFPLSVNSESYTNLYMLLSRNALTAQGANEHVACGRLHLSNPMWLCSRRVTLLFVALELVLGCNRLLALERTSFAEREQSGLQYCAAIGAFRSTAYGQSGLQLVTVRGRYGCKGALWEVCPPYLKHTSKKGNSVLMVVAGWLLFGCWGWLVLLFELAAAAVVREAAAVFGLLADVAFTSFPN